jgi:hypothetical protein
MVVILFVCGLVVIFYIFVSHFLVLLTFVFYLPEDGCRVGRIMWNVIVRIN